MRKFTFGLNIAKNANYIEKCSEQKLHRIKFPTKNSANAYLCLTQKWSLGTINICIFEILLCTEMRKFTLSRMLQKILIISKNTSNKSCAELNFLRKKTRWMHIPIYLRSRTSLFQNFALLK